MTISLASGRQVAVQVLLVDQAAFLVEGHHHRFEAVGLHVLLKVRGDVGADLLHPLGHADQHADARGGLGQHVAVQVGEASRSARRRPGRWRLCRCAAPPGAARSAAAGWRHRGWIPRSRSGSCIRARSSSAPKA